MNGGTSNKCCQGNGRLFAKGTLAFTTLVAALLILYKALIAPG
jgi:hypothetical protein